jgi:alcohol dehydrogenase
MKAFVLERYGKQRALQAADIPMPDLRADEVLVEVHAAGLNLLDVKIRDGEFKLILPYRLPSGLGHDVAGVVVKTGPQARQFKPGDEVYARLDDFRIGALAEFAPVKEASLALKPKGLTMEEAASIPLVGLTAWQALVTKANLHKGQKVFIQAGSVVSAPLPSSWPSTWAPRSPRPRARAVPHWSRAWVPTSSSITRPRISRTCCAITTWC